MGIRQENNKTKDLEQELRAKQGVKRVRNTAGIGIQQDNKTTKNLQVCIRAGTNVGTKADTKTRIRAGMRADTGRGNKKREALRQMSKKNLI